MVTRVRIWLLIGLTRHHPLYTSSPPGTWNKIEQKERRTRAFRTHYFIPVGTIALTNLQTTTYDYSETNNYSS